MLVAFTPGEPAGIGPDIAVIYAQQKINKNLLVFTDPDLLLKRAKRLKLAIKIKEGNAKLKGEISVFPIKLNAKSKAGIINLNNAKFVLNSLDVATKNCLNKTCKALITGPVHKGVINQSGINFIGHTEYLANLTNVDKTVMMLATKGLNVALATTHLPLSKVSKNIKTKSLTRTIEIIHNSLPLIGIKKPHILVCGLNPHAGEGGYLGKEEIEIINPLINKLKKNGYNISGAVPADTAFTPDSLKKHDVILAMYHDQGLPVIKSIGFKKTVNVTLGLPFIRTSVDHGTALDLAGTGNISLGSFKTALNYTKMLIKNAQSK
jgi:4-hydroxythreonine-4-phosphate dehydrogenase